MSNVNKEKEIALTQLRLKEVLEYNHQSGEFIWLVPKAQSIRVGQVVNSTHKTHGYVEVMIDGNTYKVHRLVWLYVHGEFPSGDKPYIDHIDGNRSNNRIENLTTCSAAENSRNRKIPSNNTSGVNGVSLQKRIRAFGKLHYQWIAHWCNASGKLCAKYFSVQKYGYEEAEKLAIAYRASKIKELATQGVKYSVRHGK